jgi:uncharacterized membrane protein YhiD involved in acid resistance
MFESLREDFQAAVLLAVLGRLVAAMLLGGVVAWIYQRTRPASDTGASLAITLVLLSILIAMVTQVIGDNVARAFSLVGALSIVRFRTVVRDTVDTAYVIFAVAVGMAVGANHPSVAVCGIGIIGLAAWIMMRRQPASDSDSTHLLQVRVGLGTDVEASVSPVIDSQVRSRRLLAMATAKQGMSIEATYRIELREERSAAELVKALNRVEGVQTVSINRETADERLNGFR